jgi:hypothetical protein
MADEEISRTMGLVSLSGEQESLASLATKLRDDIDLSSEATALCVNELLKRMNETLPEDKKIHVNLYYLTAREICKRPESIDCTHRVWRMFVSSAQNLKEAGDILFNVIIQYNVESMDGMPSQVTNLFVKEHAIFKANVDEMANFTPTIGVMGVLQEIILIKHSTETLVGEVQNNFIRFQHDLCKLIIFFSQDLEDAQEKLLKARGELNKNIRRADVKDIDKRLRAQLVEVLEENAELLRLDLHSASETGALCIQSQLGIVKCWIGLLKELIHSDA